MDQINQLQRQILELRNEINTISQVAGQLQRAEANNAAQLERLHQHETVANQQLNTIQQLCQHLNQDVNAISNAAQQVTTQMYRPMSGSQFNTQTFGQPISGLQGTFTPNVSGLNNPTPFGAYSAQFSPFVSTGSRNPMPDQNVLQQYTTMPFTSNMMPGSTFNTPKAGISPITGASSMMPSFTSQQHLGTSGLSSNLNSSAYMPYVSSQNSSMPGTGLLSSHVPLSTPQNMSLSNF